MEDNFKEKQIEVCFKLKCVCVCVNLTQRSALFCFLNMLENVSDQRVWQSFLYIFS